MISIDISINTPGTHQLKLSHKSMMIFISWALGTIVLINAYKGIVVSELTAKPKHNSFWKNISEADNFIFFYDHKFIPQQLGSISHVYPSKDWGSKFGYKHVEVVGGRGYLAFPKYPQFIDFYCNRISRFKSFPYNYTNTLNIFKQGKFNLPLKSIDQNFYNLSKVLDPALRQYRYNKTYFKMDYANFDKVYLLCSPIDIIVLDKHPNSSSHTEIMPFKNTIFISMLQNSGGSKSKYFHEAIKLISNCKKNGFIGRDKTLNAFLAVSGSKINGKYPVFKKGDIEFFKHRESIVFSNFYGTKYIKKLQTGLQLMISTGIYSIWIKWINYFYPSGDEKVIQEGMKTTATYGATPLSMDSNIWTAFLIYFICIGINLIVIMTETIIEKMIAKR